MRSMSFHCVSWFYFNGGLIRCLLLSPFSQVMMPGSETAVEVDEVDDLSQLE